MTVDIDTDIHPTTPPGYVIVNADDFGMCDEVNRGILQCHDHGVVTSTSLMVRWPAAEAAVAAASARPQLAVGLHIDLGEWEPAPDGTWTRRHGRVDVDDADAVAGEVTGQLAAFERMVGRPPTHIDGHQHIQRSATVAPVVREIGDRLGVPVRDVASVVAYRGEFYGQAARGEPYPEGITVASVVELIASIAAQGLTWTEIGCHPGIDVPRSVTSYADERTVEAGVLCDPAVRSAITSHALTLASFADMTPHGRAM